jgi:hypothetical protein
MPKLASWIAVPNWAAKRVGEAAHVGGAPLEAAAVHDVAGGVAELLLEGDLVAEDKVLADEHHALAEHRAEVAVGAALEEALNPVVVVERDDLLVDLGLKNVMGYLLRIREERGLHLRDVDVDAAELLDARSCDDLAGGDEQAAVDRVEDRLLGAAADEGA